MAADVDPRWGEPGPMHDPAILAGFRARPTDVLITTAPKAGTTWMQQILHQLRSGGDEEFFSIDKVVPWLELPRRGRRTEDILAGFETIDDPRIFKTHCTFEQTPGVDTARIILSSRDPRDCCTSFWHHVRDMTDIAREQSGLKLYSNFDDFLEDWLSFASWYRNVHSWWPQRDRPNLLWLRYEDMKQDFAGAIDTIIDFLGWDISPSARKQAIELSSFDWMKRHAEKFTRQLSSRDPVFRAGGFIRKGTVGDYRTRLTARQEARILDRARTMLEPECLAFLGISAS